MGSGDPELARRLLLGRPPPFRLARPLAHRPPRLDGVRPAARWARAFHRGRQAGSRGALFDAIDPDGRQRALLSWEATPAPPPPPPPQRRRRRRRAEIIVGPPAPPSPVSLI